MTLRSRLVLALVALSTVGLAIFGVGVGLDLSPYYGRCQTLDLAAPPGTAVFSDLLQLLSARRRR